MRKTLTILAVLALLAFTNAQTKTLEKPCWGTDCTFSAKGTAGKDATISELVPIIDAEVRRSYWYYLRGSNLLYQANIDVGERYITFFIYRNVVGTFLVVGSWVKADQLAQVNTFVRLGNGQSQDVQTNYSPVDIQPFIISLRLKNGEYLIEMDANGNFKVNGQLINVKTDDSNAITQEQLDAKSAAINQFVQEKYWYYLRDSTIVHKEVIITTQRIYALFTYINIVGTFLVIGSCDAEDVIQVNTFVRLGAGSTEKPQPITLQPTVVELS